MNVVNGQLRADVKQTLPALTVQAEGQQGVFGGLKALRLFNGLLPPMRDGVGFRLGIAFDFNREIVQATEDHFFSVVVDFKLAGNVGIVAAGAGLNEVSFEDAGAVEELGEGLNEFTFTASTFVSGFFAHAAYFFRQKDKLIMVELGTGARVCYCYNLLQQKKGPAMNTIIRKIGNSSGAIIPARLLQRMKLKDGDGIVIAEEQDRLVITKSGDRPRYTLEALLAECDPSAPMPTDCVIWDAAPAVGDEVL